MNIQFFQEDTSFTPKNEEHLIRWIYQVAKLHQHQIKALNYIFCSDEYLLKINQEYLDHDYYTDIITFDNSETTDHLEGDIFISIDRVLENAHNASLQFEQELHRVIVHGVLHLIGYQDKTPTEQNVMREKEEACLSLLQTISST